jgi:prepilin-type N-terminal cleavage/methylation domain-containing protein
MSGRDSDICPTSVSKKGPTISIIAAQHRRPPAGATRLAGASRAPGFTLTELLVVIGIVVVLAGLLVSVLARSRTAAHSISCVANLHAIADAFFQYAQDNNGRFPDPESVDQSWEKCLQSYIPGADAFRCPADQEIFPILGSSYDWRDTGFPQTSLAGRMLSEVSRPNVVLAFESLPGWHLRGKMNAALLDGSTLTMNQEACLSDLQLPLQIDALPQRH